MPLPHGVARFNKRVTNRFIEPIVRLAKGYVVVHHVGRVTGRPYSTPLLLFSSGSDSIAVLTYGPRADWARNVLANGGLVESASGTRHIDAAVVVDRTAAWPALPRLVRLAMRLFRIREFMQLTLGSAVS